MTSADQAATMSLSRYAEDARSLVAGAQALADARKHAEVQPLHLLARGLERDPGVVEVFRRATPRHLELTSAVERALDDLPLSKEPAYLSAAMLDLLERAEREAERDRAKTVQVEHLLNALSQEIRGPLGEILGAFALGPGSLRPHLKGLREVPRGELGNNTPSGAWFVDLVAKAREDADPVIGRVAELRRLITILERRQKSHPLLVGEPGVGKRAIVRALAGRIAAGDIPTRLANLRLLDVDTGALVAGARLRGEVEQRVRQLLERASHTGGDSVLVLESFEQLFGQGPSGSAVGELLRPALDGGQVRCLGITTPEGLRRVEERDAGVLRLFTVLGIEEPSLEVATEIIRGVASRLESHHQVTISESAIVASVRLAKRYLQDRFLPDTALDLLDEAAAAMRVEVDGIPKDVDEAIARLNSLKAQLGTLQGAEDEESRAARARLESEADALAPQVQALRERLEIGRAHV